MKIMVTGGAGFIGAGLCRALAERGDRVTALDDLSTGYATNLAGTGVQLVAGSILDRDLLDEAAGTATTIVHLAARPSVQRSIEDPLRSHDVNVTGTLNVLEAARLTGAHVILASSSSVYGDVDGPVRHEELPARPLSPYGAGKLAAEAYTLAYAATFQLPVLPMRFFNVYGPLQSSDHAHPAVIPAFIDAAMRGQTLIVNGDGLQTRDFTDVGTVVTTLVDAIDRQVTSESPVNLAFGTRTSVLELTQLIGELLDRPVTIRHNEARRGDIRESQASPALVRKLFPTIVPLSLRIGLTRTIEWFSSELIEVRA